MLACERIKHSYNKIVFDNNTIHIGINGCIRINNIAYAIYNIIRLYYRKRKVNFNK